MFTECISLFCQKYFGKLIEINIYLKSIINKKYIILLNNIIQYYSILYYIILVTEYIIHIPHIILVFITNKIKILCTYHKLYDYVFENIF